MKKMLQIFRKKEKYPPLLTQVPELAAHDQIILRQLGKTGYASLYNPLLAGIDEMYREFDRFHGPPQKTGIAWRNLAHSIVHDSRAACAELERGLLVYHSVCRAQNEIESVFLSSLKALYPAAYIKRIDTEIENFKDELEKEKIKKDDLDGDGLWNKFKQYVPGYYL